ncbi:unnamed protein product, partial [Owenia fusiformis]
RQILVELGDSLENMGLSLGPLGTILQPFIETFQDVMASIQAMTEALRGLKEGYEISKSLIDNVFGPKIAKKFPRKYLVSEECGNGFFPSTQAGKYRDDGAQLQVDVSSTLYVPFSGILRITGNNEVTIQVEEMKDTELILVNVRVDEIKDNTMVYKDEPLGTVVQTSHCPEGHIHFALKKIGRDDIINPTRYFEKRKMERPRWVQKCDDYELVWLNEVISEGSLTKGPKDVDTTPDQETVPASDMPDTMLMQEFQQKSEGWPSNILDTTKIGKSAKSLMENMGAPKISEFGPHLLSFSVKSLKLDKVMTFLQNSNNMVMAERIYTLIEDMQYL